jgi:hypothetical protein
MSAARVAALALFVTERLPFRLKRGRLWAPKPSLGKRHLEAPNVAFSTLRVHRRLIAAFAAAGGLLAATMTLTIANAAENPGATVQVACTTSIGANTEQDVSFKVTGPDSVEAGASVTTQIVGQQTTLPSEASGVQINSYENIETRVDVYGATLTGATITTPPSGPGTEGATVETSGNTVIVKIPGPIPGGSTITGATVAVTSTVTASTGGTTGLDPGSPFYKVTANTSSFGAVAATCNPADDAQTANGTLTIPVAGADSTGPNITISAPYDGAIYGYQQVVNANYSCADASGVATCEGSVAKGSPIDTGSEGPKTFTVNATDSKGNASSKSVDYLVLPPGVEPPPPPTYTAINPARILDTRPGGSTVDGTSQGGGATAPGQTLELQVAGRAGVPEDAVAAVLNITATDTTGWGYAAVFPCGEARPNASNLNYTEAGDTRPNAVVTKLGAGGKVCIFTGEAGAQLIADVDGFFPPGAAYESLNPGRVLDTRPGGSTVDNTFVGGGATANGQTIELQIAGRHGVPNDAEAVVLNVTATDTLGWGYVVAYPCGETPPTASNLNYTEQGQTTPNAVVTKLGAGGTICLATGEAGAQLIADVSGYFPAGSGYTPMNPARMLDTRPGTSTVDNIGVGVGLIPAGATVQLPIAGRAGVPNNAQGAVLNVTMTGTTGWAYVTVYPCDEARPNASNLNSTEADQTRPNAVFTKLGGDGRVCLFVGEAATHLIVDVDGYFPAPEGPVVPPFNPPTTTTTTTLPGQTTTTTSSTTLPPGAEAPPECGAYLTQAVAQTVYTLLLILSPSEAAKLDPNGNGVACEDYPFPI